MRADTGFAELLRGEDRETVGRRSTPSAPSGSGRPPASVLAIPRQTLFRIQSPHTDDTHSVNLVEGDVDDHVKQYGNHSDYV